MTKKKFDKDATLSAMADHVLEHGLNTASLRPLAKAANTSDRMLIYHFGSKDALVAELLGYVATELSVKLDAALPGARAANERECMRELVSVLRAEPVGAYMRLWFDILSAAGYGSSQHAGIGHAMIGGYVDWLTRRLPEDVADVDGTVALMLTLIEGIIVLDVVGHQDIGNRAIDRLFPAPDGGGAPKRA